jgi:hypothetical protein
MDELNEQHEVSTAQWILAISAFFVLLDVLRDKLHGVNEMFLAVVIFHDGKCERNGRIFSVSKWGMKMGGVDSPRFFKDGGAKVVAPDTIWLADSDGRSATRVSGGRKEGGEKGFHQGASVVICGGK